MTVTKIQEVVRIKLETIVKSCVPAEAVIKPVHVVQRTLLLFKVTVTVAEAVEAVLGVIEISPTFVAPVAREIPIDPDFKARLAAPVNEPTDTTLAAASEAKFIVPPDPMIANVLPDACVKVIFPPEELPTFNTCAAAPVLIFIVPAVVDAVDPKMFATRVPPEAFPLNKLNVCVPDAITPLK